MNLTKATENVIKPSQLHEYQTPYVLKLKNDNQYVYLVGVDHIRDPHDDQINKIKSLFEEWLQLKEDSSATVIVETPLEQLEFNGDIKNIIENSGEAGYLVHLAKNNSISNVVCPEPSWSDLFSSLKKEYQPRDILLWLFLSPLVHRFRRNKKIDDIDIKEIREIIEKNKDELNLDSDINSLFSYWKKKIKDMVGEDILPDTFEQLVDVTNSDIKKLFSIQSGFSNNQYVPSRIDESINWNRDRFIATNILDLIRKNKSIFGVYGSNHVVAQEPVFLEYLQELDEF